jgi:hypothetical protein
MRKLIKGLILIATLSLVSCGLLSTYDQVSLMVGIQIPLYGEQVNVGMKLDLKDQAINKLEEKQKIMSIDAYNSFLDWKMKQGSTK